MSGKYPHHVRFADNESAPPTVQEALSQFDIQTINNKGENVIKKHWQDNVSSLNQTMAHLLHSGALSDVTLSVGKEKKMFKVHKLILASRSPLFEEMFFSELAYSSNVIPLQEDNSQALRWILQHIYCNETDLDNIEAALDAFWLADKYMISSAYDISVKFIEQNTQRNNVLKIFDFIIHRLPDDNPLMNLCRKIFSDNGNAILTSSYLQEMTFGGLQNLLLQESMTVTSETVIFKALISWGTSQLRKRRTTLTSANLRREISPFLSHVRFLTMTSEEFVHNVVTSDVLTPEESVFILKYIARPDAHNTDELVLFRSADMRQNSWQISSCRQKRPTLITKERLKTCTCEGVDKTWLRDSKYEFILSSSDNIVLLAFKLQMERDGTPFKVEISKVGSVLKALSTAEADNGNVTFKNPVHLRQDVNYTVTIWYENTIHLSPSSSYHQAIIPCLRGAKVPLRSFHCEGFTITLKGGIYVNAVLFI